MLAGERVVEKSICHRVTLDLFHWQGHLLDGIRVTLALKWVVWDTCSRSFVLFFFFLVWFGFLVCFVVFWFLCCKCQGISQILRAY